MNSHMENKMENKVKPQKIYYRFKGKNLENKKQVERILFKGHNVEVWHYGKLVKVLYAQKKFSGNW